MSIHTVEGWSRYVKEGHSQILRDRGIDPTEKNLAAFQAEVTALADKLKAEKQRKDQELQDAVDEFMTIAGHMRVGDPPHDLIHSVYAATMKRSRNSALYSMNNVWYLGYVMGIRAERSRRKVKSPATAATGGGAAKKITTKNYNTVR